MATCAVAAVYAPVAGAATVSNANTDAVATYAPEATDVTHSLVLGTDPSDPTLLLFSDTVSPINPVPLGVDLGPPETCAAVANGTTATCPKGPVAITLGPGDDALAVGDGVDNATVDASTGNDQLDLHTRTAGSTVDLVGAVGAAATPAGLTFGSFESVTGGAGGDTFTVAADAPGVTIIGGAGGDTFRLPSGSPPVAITGGAGTDRLDYSQRTAAVDVDLVAGTADSATLAGVENVTGGSGGDTITGDAGPNVENGGGGNDALKGGDGDDTLNGGGGINSLDGGAGDDTLTAGGGGDLIDGGVGADTITGGGGNDYIIAADGFADTIDCGAGANDTVVADLGADVVKDTFKNCENVQGTVRITTTTPGDSTTTTLQPVILVPSVTPALTPVLAPGKADFADLTPPSAAMRSFTRQRLATVANRGVPLRVTCKEACGISVALSVDRTTARRLKLDSRVSPVIIATASAQRRGAGTTQLRVKFTKKAGAALKKSTRSVVATAQVLVSDASGNGTLLSRHVTFVR